MDAAIASTALLSLTSSVSIFNSLCPPLHEVTQSSPRNPVAVTSLRTGEVAAVSLSIAIGLVGTMLTKSPAPLLLAALAAGALVFMYESVQNIPPVESK